MALGVYKLLIYFLDVSPAPPHPSPDCWLPEGRAFVFLLTAVLMLAQFSQYFNGKSASEFMVEERGQS